MIFLHVSSVFPAMNSSDEDRKVLAQFKDENGVLVKVPFDIPINITPDLLQSLCNTVVAEVIPRVVCRTCLHCLMKVVFAKFTIVYH